MAMSSPAKALARKQNSCSSSVGQSVKGPKASSQLLKHFSQAAASGFDEIAADLQSNIELQLIVKATIKDYKDNLALAEQHQMSLVEMVGSTREQRKRQRQDDSTSDEDDVKSESDEEELVAGEIRRGQLVFASWNSKMANEAMRHCDKRVMSADVVKVMKLRTKLECLEMGLDIVCFGDRLDRVGSKDKIKQIQNMRVVYKQLGERWQHLEIEMPSGEVKWLTCAPWLMKEQRPLHVIIILRGWAREGENAIDVEVELNDTHFMGDDGPYSLHMPFSLRQAGVQSTSTNEVYSLSSLVPGVRRRLGRRPSQTANATNSCKQTAAEYDESISAKRRGKAKAKSQVKTFKKPITANMHEEHPAPLPAADQVDETGLGSGVDLDQATAEAKAKAGAKKREKNGDQRAATADASGTESETPSAAGGGDETPPPPPSE